MIAPYLDDNDVPAVTYDLNDDSVVVISSARGSGGGTIADELTRRGIDVVVLEAGPRFKMSDFVNDEWAMYDRLTWEGHARLHRRLPHRPRLPDGTDLDLQGAGRHHAPLGGHVPAPARLRVQGALHLRRCRWRGSGGLAARLRRDGALLA